MVELKSKQNENLDDNLLKNNDEELLKIKKYPIDEYIQLIDSEPGDYDCYDGRKAAFIYDVASDSIITEMPSGQVGIEFEDGTFAVVGVNRDRLCRTKKEMLNTIAFGYDYIIEE